MDFVPIPFELDRSPYMVKNLVVVYHPPLMFWTPFTAVVDHSESDGGITLVAKKRLETAGLVGTKRVGRVWFDASNLLLKRVNQ